jgi:hypothetical protein
MVFPFGILLQRKHPIKALRIKPLNVGQESANNKGRNSCDVIHYLQAIMRMGLEVATHLAWDMRTIP